MTTPLTPMSCDGLAESLADYLEGDAPESVRHAIDAHAAVCDDCRTLLADLRDISAGAASLPMLQPSHDLWAGIAERIDAPVLPIGARTVRVLDARRTWLRPAAAAAALVIATAGITHYLTRATYAPTQQVAARTPSQAAPSNVATPNTSDVQPASPEATAEFSSTATERAPRAPVVAVSRTSGNAARSPGATSAAPLMGDAEPVYDSEIGKLRRIVKQRRNDLDPKTVAVLEQSIAVIDSAIAQSRAALRKDPASGFLANQLNHSLEKKVELLRTAAMLPART